jgi:hypothetical protein
MGRLESSHATRAHLQLSHHLPGASCVFGLREDPDLGENIPLAAGAGPALGLLPGIEVAAATAPEDYEHEKRKDFQAAGSSMALITPSCPGRLVMRASPISVLMIAPLVRMFLLM